MQILSSASAGGGEEAALDIEAVQAQLRGALLKLQYADAYLRKLPAGCSFEVVAYTSAERGGVGAVPLAEWAEEQAGPGHLELRQVGWDWAGWLAGWGRMPGFLSRLVVLAQFWINRACCGCLVTLFAIACTAHRPKLCPSSRARSRAPSSCSCTAKLEGRQPQPALGRP